MKTPRNPLRLYSEDGDRGERHATWLELFFDLVFVVAIAELAHGLHDHLTWAGIVEFIVLFVPVWWLWIDFSYFADQFDVDRGFYRVVMLAVMFGIVVLSIRLPEALHGGSAAFATIYATLRLVIIGLYIQAWRFVPQSRELTARYTLSFAIALALWLISIVVAEPLRFWLWGAALLIEIGNGPVTYTTIRSVPAQVSHMDERFGLFVIIVLGEAIIAVASGVAGTNWQWQAALTAAAGFVAAVSLWWMYFERADASVINAALRGNKQALLNSFIYGYSHVLVFAGIVATGIGIQAAIEAVIAQDGLAIAARSVLCGGVALFLLGLSAVQWSSPRSLPRHILFVRLAAACLCVALIGGSLIPLLLVGLLALGLVSLATFESVGVNTSVRQ